MSQCFLMKVNPITNQDTRTERNDAKPAITKEKVMSYEEKSFGSTSFFKCEACPFMALAEDDIKFHLFTAHPDLAKNNGLADNIQISCPGCVSVFDAEETLRTHLRNHHKMGIKDVKKMVKSLIQIALKDAKLRKKDSKPDPAPPPVRQEISDVKMPHLIEICPDVNVTNESFPKGVSFISVDELQKMSTPNFEQVDPKEIIQEASINIVYTNEVSTQYINVNEVPTSSACNVQQMSNVTPDLISSIQPRVSVVESNNFNTETIEESITLIPTKPKPGRQPGARTCIIDSNTKIDVEKELGNLCSVNGCHLRLKDAEKLSYHRKCHQNKAFRCLECNKIYLSIEHLHTHLWKMHAIDMELSSCTVCGYKTYNKYRLYNIHMKCHANVKNYTCSICMKAFKNTHQLSKHKLIHNKDISPVPCTVCQKGFNTKRQMILHRVAVHEKLKPFKCNDCNYTAARKEELKMHTRSHTGDKPYSCEECNYRASDHNAMRRHKKQHTQDSLYKCKICPYTAIQSTTFAAHMLSKHPHVPNNDIFLCLYCPFKSVNKDKYLMHLTTHTDKEEVNIQIETKKNKPSWTIPSETDEKKTNNAAETDEGPKQLSPTANTTPLEVYYDCDSLSENFPQNFSKTYCQSKSESQQATYDSQVNVPDDKNSDCLISESSNDVIIENVDYDTPHSLQDMVYDKSKPDIHSFLNNPGVMDENLLQSSSVSSLVTNHSPINSNISNNIMSNFPIRLPLAPQISVRNNITLKPVNKIQLPVTTVTGPIITPTQILPVPSSSNSPVNIINELEGVPRKKPKISVKSNLILKGPDQINMFHSQQQMAFKRLEDNERFCLNSPVTFNNLITTHSFMQLQTEPAALSESPSDIVMPYSQENLMAEAATTPEDSGMADNSQMFTFNQQLNVNSMAILPPPQKIQSNDPSYIKLEATIKQNTQSPSLERMCNANIMSSQEVSREYKASPPLEDMHKNIKNELKSDSFYNIPLNNSATNPSIIDQFLMDNVMSEQYPGHVDLSTVVLPQSSDDQQNDVIEIDDNSDDNKLLPRFDMNFPLESLYLIHNDFHFLDNEIATSSLSNEAVNEMNRMVTEVPITNQKENINSLTDSANEYTNYNQGKKDPMMNTPIRSSTNKINVKNIELMKN